MENNALKIYDTPYGDIDVQIDYQADTIWLNKQEIAKLFNIDRSGVSRHINNIFKSGEIEEKSNVQKMHIPNSDKPVEFYNLDIVLAVGYRANSIEASRFRKWATGILKQYLVDGYAVNEKRLLEQKSKITQLQNAIKLLSRCIENQANTLNDAQNLAKVLENFAQGLELLDDYDNKTLATKGLTKREAVKISKEEYLQLIAKMKPEFGSDVFANPKDDSFDSSINQIYQTFGGVELYQTLEEKASMLLYFLVKNHGFTDGNKRIGAACFLYFLDKNGILYKNSSPIIDNATLFTLTLLIAESKPEEKETMKQVILSVLNNG